MRICTTLRKLSETAPLFTVKDLHLLVASVREFWKEMPLTLKSKITWSTSHVIMETMASTNDVSELESACKKLVDGFLLWPCASDWDGDEPSLSAVVNEALQKLEVAVSGVAMDIGKPPAAETAGDDDESDSLTAAGKECSRVLQD